MPVRPRQFKGHPLRVDPFAVWIFRVVGNPERPEVDVLNVTDVVTLIDEDAAFDGVASDVANEVAGGADQYDALVGIEKTAIDDAHVLGVVRFDAWRVGGRRHDRLFPIRIFDHEPRDHRV